MDGVLQVTTTEDPSIVAFRIDTYDCTLEGMTQIDLELVGANSAADCITKLLDSIAKYYTGLLLRDRDEAKETIQ